eukprot:CAMPEP_0119562238 /NCGR_PEP_ID=MMETSP1352-20130426/19843_1 /TAXON_ID=265584 /ORGANISM="Stauroneis constricta, Strain CCMP1120" /LENGTH=1031 /DNA_ID=CAMNT_0007610597 /DNA_START=126 /DNA_END=3221 /DNA_ORIENTATION=-
MSSYMQPQQHPSGNVRTKMVQGYALQQKLGSGSFATVYKGVRVPQSQQQQSQQQQQPDADDNRPDAVAIKAITRTSEKLTKKVLQNLEIEISILRTYRHPNIVCMHNVQKTERHFYLILEYCGGGDVQRLIRTRKAGRLTEGLTRRLTRDLAAGLKFLWGQELIHRDIKPQNLLLTGPLPLDEINDPERSPDAEKHRRLANFPTDQFQLKIADFGFARHLQTASLAETLCGSPLYMAPEILQHQQYDAKADLWSVGTVLFEMVTGRPPFNGENHIDLLRNIQRNSVRLPRDVRVSKECVNLLRVLLNRNPLSRAGFKEFFEACDAFVALGCKGVASQETGTCRKTNTDLGTIHEDDGAAEPGSDSLMTVATTAPGMAQQQQQQQQQYHNTPPQQQQQVQPPFTRANLYNQHQQQQYHNNSNNAMLTTQGTTYPTTIQAAPSNQRNRLAPLQPSPPGSTPSAYSNARIPMIPALPVQGVGGLQTWQTSAAGKLPVNVLPRVDFSQSGGAASSDESGFVMVDRDVAPRTDPYGQIDGSGIAMTAPHQQHHQHNSNMHGAVVPNRRVADGHQQQSPHQQQQRYLLNAPSVMPGRGDYSIPRSNSKGILSTSPGTGGLLMGLVGRMPQRLGYAPSSPSGTNSNNGNKHTAGGGGAGGIVSTNNISSSPQRLEVQIAAANKLLATAEDVGRRAVSVAHLGDTRAYLAMRLLVTSGESSSMLSSMPMDGVIEEPEGDDADGNDSNGSSSTEVMSSTRRRSSVSEKVMADAKKVEDEEVEEMPFAMSPEATPVSLPTRQSHHSVYNSSKSSSANTKPPPPKATPQNIRAHFGEALACYLKALRMIKSAVNGAHKVAKEYEILATHMGSRSPTSPPQGDFAHMRKRCEVTSQWLTGQFKGVLERANASQVEINKLQVSTSGVITPVLSVEELIYNHSLACGREGAVKQLLGQHDAARSCYRSAGLLLETLMMEQSITKEDRKILEDYVDGFATRITEVDQLMLQHSRMATSVASSRRGSGIVGLIAPPPAAPSFLVNPR